VPGALFERESDTLSAARVKSGATLILEAGSPLRDNEWQLNYRIITGNKQTPTGGGKDAVKSALTEIIVPSNITCEELKKRAILFAGLDVSEHERRRIRMVHATFEEGAGLVRCRMRCVLPRSA